MSLCFAYREEEGRAVRRAGGEEAHRRLRALRVAVRALREDLAIAERRHVRRLVLDAAERRLHPLAAEELRQVLFGPPQRKPPVRQAHHAGVVGELPGEHGRAAGRTGRAGAVRVAEHRARLRGAEHVRGRNGVAVDGVKPPHVVGVQVEQVHSLVLLLRFYI